MNPEPKVKAAYCHCGKATLLAVMPDAEIDTDSVKAFQKCAKGGLRIEYITLQEARSGGMCLNKSKCKAA